MAKQIPGSIANHFSHYSMRQKEALQNQPMSPTVGPIDIRALAKLSLKNLLGIVLYIQTQRSKCVYDRNEKGPNQRPAVKHTDVSNIPSNCQIIYNNLFRCFHFLNILSINDDDVHITVFQNRGILVEISFQQPHKKVLIISLMKTPLQIYFLFRNNAKK